MSLSAASTPPVLHRPSAWPLYVGFLCLGIAAWPLLAQGLSAWRDDDDLRDVVARFFRAVAEGRTEAALDFLSTDYRHLVMTEWQSTRQAPWTKTDDLTVQVLSVRQRGDKADVQVSLSKSGFSIKPIVQLRRTKQAWHITRLDGVSPDPRWIRGREIEAGEAIVYELAAKLHLVRVKSPAQSQE